MKNLIRSLSVVAVCALGFQQAARGSVIAAQYTFTGSSFASSDSDALSAAGNLTAVGYTKPGTGIDATTGNTAPSFRIDKLEVSASQPTGKYLEFTVTAVSGYMLNLAGGNLSFDFASGTDTKSVNWAVSSSVLGFTVNIATGSSSSSTFGNVGTGVLSGSQYDGLSSVTFRVYGWDGNNVDVLFDNIVLSANSVTPVPEPMNAALAAFGLIFVGGGVGRFYLRRAQRAVAA